TSFVPYYGFEARPYGICFMLAAAVLWVWIFTGCESRAGALAFGALFFVGLMTHYYFVFCMAPFCVLALAERRIFHLKLLSAGTGVAIALLILYPQIVTSRASVGNNLA